MRSLRLQLLLGTALGITAVLLVSGVVLYALISRTLWDEFDQSLAAKARSLTALTEQDGDGLEFELTEISLPEFEFADHPEFYQVWLPDGTVFARSPSLLGGDLDRISGASDSPAFQTVLLPSGHYGRLVGMTVVPRQESVGGDANTSMKVTLVVGREIVGLQDTLARVRWMLFAVGVVAVVLSSVVLAWVVRRSLKPVDDLSIQIAEVGADDLSARIGAGGVPLELAPVVERLNDLLIRLDAAFQRERRFTGDVAHELRTPLAGLRSTLELALSRERTPESYRKTVDDCLEINLQMQRMVESLLHLARADAGQLEVQREALDLPAFIRECWNPLQDKANERGLSVEWRLAESCPVETDRDKLRLVLQNVLDNAVTHVNDAGSISIALIEESGTVSLTVGNTGNKLSSQEIRHVFERFWRSDSSYPVSAGHYGLGLPLCKAVIEQLGGSIQASTTREALFVLTIRLPRAE
ncbi:MAG: ATP-binding protein [Planctomycetota bacterium]